MSHVVRVAAAALWIAAAPAARAASFYCSEPSEPFIFVGETSRSAMDLMKLKVESYLEDVKEYLACLEQHRGEVVREAEAVIDEWEMAVHLYNARQR